MMPTDGSPIQLENIDLGWRLDIWEQGSLQPTIFINY